MIIGIDPGKKTGVAFSENGKLIDLQTTDFWGVISIIDETEAYYVVEKPNNKHVWGGRAIDVGSVIREAELIVERLELIGRDFVTVHPKGKIDANEFKQITGWQGRTNSHVRDAGMLLYKFGV